MFVLAPLGEVQRGIFFTQNVPAYSVRSLGSYSRQVNKSRNYQINHEINQKNSCRKAQPFVYCNR